MGVLVSGMDMMVAPMTWHVTFTTWRLSLGWDILLVLATAGYLLAAVRVGREWPARRTAAFLGAMVVAAVTFNSSIEIYSHVLFSIHMVQHLLLIMAVPALVIAGSPLTLAARVIGGGRVERVLRRQPIAAITYPGIGLGLYTVVIVATHLTSFMQVMLEHMWVHDAEQVLYLVAGYLFLLPLIGSEPIRWRLSYPIRLLSLFIGMTADTVVGVVLIQTEHEPFPGYAAMHRTWGLGLVSDIQWGGGIMWVAGDGLMFVFIVLVMIGWLRHAETQGNAGSWLEAARRGALAETGEGGGGEGLALSGSADVDTDDNALAAYNAMLGRLNADPPRR